MPKLVLVVDDDSDIRANLRAILQDEGFVVLTADNGQSALDLLRSTTDLPSLILLDVMMPKMDGCRFRAEQKLDAKLAPIPVVVLTAGGERTRAIDAQAVLLKPFDIDDLLDAVERHACHG